MKIGRFEMSYDFPSNIYTIDGIKVSGEALEAFLGKFPDDRTYRFVRQDDIVKVRMYYDPEPAA